jgi:hypothetical protein
MNTVPTDKLVSCLQGLDSKLLILGCGILEKEVRYICKKNNWDVNFWFFDSSLHCSLKQLSETLLSALKRKLSDKQVVFYGSCHPLMDRMLKKESVIRTMGQNCIEMLIGEELFQSELEKGTFFLLEDWALRWDYILLKSFGDCHLDIVKEIFQTDRTKFLAIKTPCSEDFSEKAMETSEVMGVPLYWMDVSLEHLETVLYQAILNTINGNL